MPASSTSGADKRPCKCSECHLSFPWERDLKRHLTTHTGERPFTCDDCDKTYARKDALIRHRRSCRKRRSTESNAEEPGEPGEGSGDDLNGGWDIGTGNVYNNAGGGAESGPSSPLPTRASPVTSAALVTNGTQGYIAGSPSSSAILNTSDIMYPKAAASSEEQRRAEEAERDANLVKLELDLCRERSIAGVVRMLELGMSPDAIVIAVPTVPYLLVDEMGYNPASSSHPTPDPVSHPIQDPFSQPNLHPTSLFTASPSLRLSNTMPNNTALWPDTPHEVFAPLIPTQLRPTSASDTTMLPSTQDSFPPNWFNFGLDMAWLAETNELEGKV